MYDFKFADIGEGIHEGQLLKWMFKVGDKVKEGDTLCIVETDKVNAEIPSPVDGKIVKIGAEVGETIHVGETLVLLDDGTSTEVTKETDGNKEKSKEQEPVEESKGKPVAEGEETSAGVVGEIEVSSDVIESSQESSEAQKTGDVRVLATPVARKLAADLNVDIKALKGTGENGRVMKTDVEKAAQTVSQPATKQEAAPAQTPKMPQISAEGTRRVAISKLRKTIAKNMSLSKQIIPHTTVMDEFVVTNLVNFRKDQKALAESLNVKLTYMAFIIKAVTQTLKDYPIFNTSFDHDTDEIIYKDFINMGIAVDTPDGLIVPNIKNADKKSIFTLAQELQEMAKKANDRTLTLENLQNGTFTITNYGAFDSTFGAPVIKHPEVAILGIGKITKKPVVINDEIVIGDVIPVSLSIDHRVIDGGDAGRFMMRFKEYLTNPMLLLMR